MARSTRDKRLRVLRLAGLSVVIGAGGVLLWAGLSKLMDLSSFSAPIADHGVVPDELVASTAWLVTLVEISLPTATLYVATKTGLVVRPLVVLGLPFWVFSIYALVASFTPAAADSSCGCLGTPATSANWPAIALQNGLVAGGLTLPTLIGVGFRVSPRT